MPDPHSERHPPPSSQQDRPAEEQRRRPGRWRKALRIGVSLALLILIFVGVIPQFASYSQAWSHTTNLADGWWVAIGASAAANQLSAVWPYQAALPGLRFGLGLLETQTTSAISSTVPAGGAVAVGMTYKMFSSFGFSDLLISTAVVVTGIWNLAAKFGLPVVAVTLLAIIAHPPGAVVGTAALGVVALIVAGVALWLVFRSEASAHWLGRRADRAVNWALHFFHKPPTSRIEKAVLEFRSQTVDTVHRRGWLLTWAVLGGQLTSMVLVLVIVRAVGITSDQVSFAAVLTSFALARLAGALPITPGGLGTVDAAFVGALTAFGANSAHALAADLIWRLTTY